RREGRPSGCPSLFAACASRGVKSVRWRSLPPQPHTPRQNLRKPDKSDTGWCLSSTISSGDARGSVDEARTLTIRGLPRALGFLQFVFGGRISRVDGTALVNAKQLPIDLAGRTHAVGPAQS